MSTSFYYRISRFVSMAICLSILLAACQAATPTPPVPIPETTKPPLATINPVQASPTPTLQSSKPSPIAATPTPTKLVVPGKAYNFIVAGNTIIVQADLGTWLFDASTLKPIRQIIADSNNLSSLRLSPDGKQLAVFFDGKASIWNLAGDKLDFILEWAPDSFQPGEPPLAWSGDSALLYKLNGTEGIEIIDAATGKKVKDASFEPEMSYAFFIPQERTQYRIAWSPDGKYLAMYRYSSSSEVGVIIIKEIPSVKTLLKFKIGTSPQGTTCAGWLPDSKKIALISFGSYGLWDLPSLQGTKWAGPMNCDEIIPSPDGSRMLVKDVSGNIYIHEVARKADTPLANAPQVLQAAWILDGKQLLLLSTSGFFQLWDAEKGVMIKDQTN